ncbi:surfeit locus protein 1-like [Penaeus japonicus]|uniref:surfeit locus protein 1-like n=1 Tax=Penaeus japonicus TaxID=27405 RepID=UPI001C70FC63|nr:surfeit locus protein 1-like [Penaeus japonicus]
MIPFIRHGIGYGRQTLVRLSKSSSGTQMVATRCPVLLQQNASHRKSTALRLMSTSISRTDVTPSSLLLLIVPISTFCLGTWQYQRRKWKLNLIAELEEKTKAPPVELPQDLYELNDLEYQRVKLKGTFDHSREVFLGPRPLMIGGDINTQGSGLISSGQSGYLVITPFKLADRDLEILVNRGWVARKHKNPESRLEGQVKGTVSLTAVVRKHENRAPFMPDNSKGSPIFTFRDVTTMSEMLGTAPVFLDAVDTFPGGPAGGQTRVTLRNEHLSYMFTWYSLSLATAFMWYHRFIRGKPLM